jgi:two-component system NtrC family response regulator
MGESGTGKELIAEALHDASLRREKTLVKVNCAALPGNLLESELFGYVKGAFTGAVKDKPGRFQLARGGTLFLDEIGEMPVELQAKLLRALQERVIEPLGSVRPVDVDVRIVAATNRDLRKAIEQGDFREDLFFRLNVLEVVSPPLRERIDDIPLLVSRLVDKLSRKNRKEVRSVSPEFLDALMAYHWPGNVRELENVLERALILSRSDILGPESLPAQLLQAEERRDPLPQRMVSTALVPSFDDAERETLLKALEAHNGHREKTADALGISRRTLQYKLKKFGLTRRS